MAPSRRVRIGALVALWALAGLIVVMHGGLQYITPSSGGRMAVQSLRANAPWEAAPRTHLEQDEQMSQQKTEHRTGSGFGYLLGGLAALAVCTCIAVQPAAASDDDGIVRFLRGGSITQTFGQNNINNGVGSYHRANLSAATQANLLQLGIPLAAIIGVVNANRAGGFRRGW